MDAVETVKGPIRLDELGVTLMHEHVFILNMEIEGNFPERWDEEVRREDAVKRLRQVRSRGIDTIVDLTVLGLGRYVPRVQEVAAEVDLNIVVATGLYTYGDLPFFFHFRGPGTLTGGPELLTDMFVKDITEGIADTGVKAAIIKCVTDKAGVTPGVERVLRASARAHLETGVPITTHTDAHSERGLDQQRIFAEEGVDLTRVVLGHSGDSTDLDYLKKLMDAGSYIGMDRFGIDIILPFEDRVATVAKLCEAGYADRMVLSHDASCFSHNFDLEFKAETLPNWTYTHISDDVLPALRESGVTEAQITQMMVENPRNILARSDG